MTNYKLIMFKNPVIVTNQNLIQDEFPYIVAEQLITRGWSLQQIDNLNDIDEKTQLRVIGGLSGLPSVDFSRLNREDWNSLFKFTTEDIKNAIDLSAHRNFGKETIIDIISQKVFNCEFEDEGDTLLITKLY